MLYATKDDPASQKVLDFKLWAAIFLVGGMMLTFFIGQFNLLLGLEKDQAAVVTSRQSHVGARSNHYTISFKTDSGSEFEVSLNSVTNRRIPLGKDQQVTLRTDGLLWRKVVAIDIGKGFERLP